MFLACKYLLALPMASITFPHVPLAGHRLHQTVDEELFFFKYLSVNIFFETLLYVSLRFSKLIVFSISVFHAPSIIFISILHHLHIYWCYNKFLE